MFVLGYNSLTELNSIPCASKFAGSGSLRNYGDLIYNVDNSLRPREIKGNIYKNYLQTVKYCKMLNIPISNIATHPDAKKIANYERYINQYQELRRFMDKKNTTEKPLYKINKQRVRKRLTALCRLEKSKQFLAFYSISFPVKTADNVIYQIFNKWLTNCRTRYGLTTYVWVCERQKNGTLHFHLLTNNRMEIQTINKAMARSIETTVNQGLAEWGSSSKTLYNGVDVDCVQKPKKRQHETREAYRKRIKAYSRSTIYERIRWATLYMTKYMTKNDETFTHMPSHCSRDISQLFTSIVLSDKDAEIYLKEMIDDPNKYDIRQNDRMTFYIFKDIQPEIVYSMLDKLNNILYYQYHEERRKPQIE